MDGRFGEPVKELCGRPHVVVPIVEVPHTVMQMLEIHLLEVPPTVMTMLVDASHPREFGHPMTMLEVANSSVSFLRPYRSHFSSNYSSSPQTAVEMADSCVRDPRMSMQFSTNHSPSPKMAVGKSDSCVRDPCVSMQFLGND